VAATQSFGGCSFATLFNNQIREVLQSSLNEAKYQSKSLRMWLHFNDTPELEDQPSEYPA
jgi:hypothetical protein